MLDCQHRPAEVWAVRGTMSANSSFAEGRLGHRLFSVCCAMESAPNTTRKILYISLLWWLKANSSTATQFISIGWGGPGSSSEMALDGLPCGLRSSRYTELVGAEASLPYAKATIRHADALLSIFLAHPQRPWILGALLSSYVLRE